MSLRKTIILILIFVSISGCILYAEEPYKMCPSCGSVNTLIEKTCNECQIDFNKYQPFRKNNIAFHYAFINGNDADLDEEELLGFSVLSYEHIYKSGFGFQFNPFSYYGYKAFSETNKDNGDLISINGFSAIYLAISLIKYHYKHTSLMSPYLGIGVSVQRGMYYLGKKASAKYEWSFPAIVLNSGVNIFSSRIYTVLLDYKYFIGKKAGSFNTNISAFTVGVSKNW